MAGDSKLRFSIKPAYSFGVAQGLEKEIAEIRDMEIEWDSSYTTSLRKGYVLELFERHRLLDEFKRTHWPLGNTSEGERFRQRLLGIKKRYEAFLAGDATELSTDVESEMLDEAAQLMFPLEAHLRDFIVSNIGSIDVRGRRLQVFVDQEGRRGVEYQTGVGPIDVLAQDGDGNLVVFELKVSKGPDRALGQAFRYMGWIRKHLGREVSAVIVAHEIGEKLLYAVSVAPNVSLFEYKINFELRPVGLE